jgi:hypothetical protein
MKGQHELCGGLLKCSLWLEHVSRELLTAALHVFKRKYFVV